MEPGRVIIRFDDHEHVTDGVTLWLYHLDSPVADWNLGRAGAFWLSGTATPSPVNAEALRAARFKLELRSLDETLEALTQKSTTYYPVGDLVLSAIPEGDLVRLELSSELDWDYYPAPEKPSDYRRHHVTLQGLVAMRHGTGADS